MKSRLIKVFASLVLVVLAVFLVVPNFSHISAAEGEKTYTKVDLADIQPTDEVIIVSTKGTANYAMSNGNGTTGAPTAVDVTISGDTITTDVTNILWNIYKNGDNLTICPNGETNTWLYSTNSNNGVRVGDSANKTFVLDKSGYLVNTDTTSNRYLGVYNGADWRTYTSIHANIAGQTFSFYSYRNNCQHANTTTIPEVPATCTNAGTAAGVQCTDCGKIIGCETIASKGGHDWDENYVCKVCKATGPDAIADVPNYDDGTKVVVLGTVSNIDKEWSGTYNNISVYISDADGKTLYLYRLATKVEVGDIIRVTGTKSTYKNSAQIAEGATAEILKPTVKGMSATLNKGVTINVIYDIPELWIKANPGAKAVFSNSVEVALEAGVNKCSVDLKPGEINDDLTVKIQIGGTVYGKETDVSFTAYRDKINATDAATLKITETKRDALVALIDAALKYSAAADQSLVGNLVDDYFAGVADKTLTDNETLLGYAGTLGEYATMKILVNKDNVGKQTITVKVGEKTVVDAKALADYVNADGHIVIDKLYPTHFNDVITIQVNGEDVLVCTFNSYLKDIYRDTSDAELKNLAAATYLYGVAAEAFVK